MMNNTTQGVWVKVRDSIDITGWKLEALQDLADHLTDQPENQRAVKIRQRADGSVEFWLPDLVRYVFKHSPDD
jgi:hypothetical protein